MQGEPPTVASKLTGAVFLSYASQDAEAAQRIANTLKAAGIEVWFDRAELRGGDAWDRQIRAQIHECRLFMPIISAHTEARVEGYFRREWKLAVDRTHDLSERVAFLVPVAIDSTPEQKADVPEAFRHVQWTRLPGGQASTAFVERVWRLLTPDASTAPGTLSGGGEIPASTVTSTARQKPLSWAAAVVAAVVIGYLVADKFWVSKHALTDTHATASGDARSASAAGGIPEKSIAVLPFVDMSEKHDQEYFSDGLSEELIDLLTKVPELRVPARTSSFSFKGKSDDIATIAQRLRVQHVLEGSVRKAGNTIRVTAQLIRADNGYHLWSETYDRDLKDVFKVQDQIASEVVQALKVKLVGPIGHDTASTENVSAHSLLLQGRYFQERWARGDSERAILSFQQALSEDPHYALAWTELAWALLWQLPWDYERTTAAAVRAIELQPDLALAHATRGWCASLRGYDWALAVSELDKALALEPENMRALYGKGRLARVLRRFDESIRYYQAAIEQDPINPNPMDGLSATLVAVGRSEEAVQLARRALEISPNIQWGHWYLAQALFHHGQLDAALSEAQLEPVASLRLSSIALIERARHPDAADAALRELLTTNDPDKTFQVARVYADRGDAQAAVTWLEQARALRAGWLGELSGDPAFDPIRGDVHFAAFLRKINLPE
jgi:TolB-like protein/Tfp pilus assembly protein PilF